MNRSEYNLNLSYLPKLDESLFAKAELLTPVEGEPRFSFGNMGPVEDSGRLQASESFNTRRLQTGVEGLMIRAHHASDGRVSIGPDWSGPSGDQIKSIKMLMIDEKGKPFWSGDMTDGAGNKFRNAVQTTGGDDVHVHQLFLRVEREGRGIVDLMVETSLGVLSATPDKGNLNKSITVTVNRGELIGLSSSV